MIGNLSHIAIAVPDIEIAILQYKKVFEALVSSPKNLPNHGVRVALVKLQNTTIELITPIDATSPLKKFLKKNPKGGVHHLGYEVVDIMKARDVLTTAGFHVIGDGHPTVGYHGHSVLFFHPKDCFGTLIELEEVAPSKIQENHNPHPRGSIHTPPPTGSDSFGGMEGIGIEIEVDFKTTTPSDNQERE